MLKYPDFLKTTKHDTHDVASGCLLTVTSELKTTISLSCDNFSSRQ